MYALLSDDFGAGPTPKTFEKCRLKLMCTLISFRRHTDRHVLGKTTNEDILHVISRTLTDEAVRHWRNGHANPDGMPELPEWSEEAHLKLMDRHGISKSILSISTPGTNLVFNNPTLAAQVTRECNSYAADLRQRLPRPLWLLGKPSHSGRGPLPPRNRPLC